MDVHTPLLLLHAAAGTAGLLLGPAAAIAGVRRSSGTGWTAGYQGAVTVVCASALGLAAMDLASFWWLIPFAAGTQAAIILARRSRHPAQRTRLLGGSYVSLVTALLVVSWGNPLAWILPTVLGVAVVEAAAARAGQSQPLRLNRP